MSDKYIPGHNGKMPFITENEARHAARNNKYGKKLRVYRCNAQGFLHWHTTSMPRKQQRVVVKKFKPNRY